MPSNAKAVRGPVEHRGFGSVVHNRAHPDELDPPEGVIEQELAPRMIGLPVRVVPEDHAIRLQRVETVPRAVDTIPAIDAHDIEPVLILLQVLTC